MRVMPGGTLPVQSPQSDVRPPLPQAAVAGRGSAEPTAHEVRQASAALNAVLQSFSTRLQFVVDGNGGKAVVRVIDGETNEVIRQIPSAETLAIARELDRMQGLLLHQKA